MTGICSAPKAQLSSAPQLCHHLPLPKGENLLGWMWWGSLQGFGEGEEMGREARNWLCPSFLSLLRCQDGSLQGFPSGVPRWIIKNQRNQQGDLKTACLGEGLGGSGFLDIGAPKLKQIPSARLL